MRKKGKRFGIRKQRIFQKHDEKDVNKLKTAGADFVIVPALSGAEKLARIIMEKWS